MESVTFSNDFDKDILYDKYDQAINVVMVNIYTLTKEKSFFVRSKLNINFGRHFTVNQRITQERDSFTSC